MRRLILSMLLALVAPVLTCGQVVNGGFEDWEKRGPGEHPVGWYSNGIGVGKTETSHNGRFAVTVWNWYYYSRGYVVSGEAEASWLDPERGGVPIGFKPARLSGFYRYELGSNSGKKDSAVVVVVLKRFNVTTQTPEVISTSALRLGPAAAFTPFSLDIEQGASDAMPDSIAIALISSDSGFCSVESDGTCLYFSVDELRLENSAGLPFDAMTLFERASVTPNPVRGIARAVWPLSSGRAVRVAVYTAAGTLARTIQGLSGSEAFISSEGLAVGRYFFEAIGADGRIVARGSFAVE